jgi:hypothetical protein
MRRGDNQPDWDAHDGSLMVSWSDRLIVWLFSISSAATIVAMKSLLLALCSTALLAHAADVPSAPLAKKGAVIVSDDFERTELAPWRATVPTFTVGDGVLKGSQTRADHGAVGAVKAPMKDGIIEFKFRLDGAASFNAVCDDKAWKGSHAGHICRVTVTPKLIRLGDDKEGGMRNDIMEMRKDPARKAAGNKLMVGRTAAFPVPIAPGQWHRLSIEIVGDEMRVSVDDKPTGYLKSPGFAHPTKSDFHFTVSGKDALFDEVHIYAAEPAKK